MASIGAALSVLVAALGPALVSAPAAGYVWPLSPEPGVHRGYEAPPQRWATGHRGADLIGRPGQSVSAAGPGVIGYRGSIAGRGIVTVIHPNGWRTSYEPVFDAPAVGTAVLAGDRIGTLEPTSAHSHCAPQVCLHWGLIVGPDTYRDPLTLLERPDPVLIPLG